MRTLVITKSSSCLSVTGRKGGDSPLFRFGRNDPETVNSKPQRNKLTSVSPACSPGVRGCSCAICSLPKSRQTHGGHRGNGSDARSGFPNFGGSFLPPSRPLSLSFGLCFAVYLTGVRMGSFLSGGCTFDHKMTLCPERPWPPMPRPPRRALRFAPFVVVFLMQLRPTPPFPAQRV